jgi:pyrroline-5-carboxylate reductase
MIVALIGAGHIADALVRGWRRPLVAEPPALLVFDIVAERAQHLAAAGGGRAAASASEAVAAADLVVLAVRPEHVESVLAEIAPAVGARPVVSVAAGVSVARLVAALPAGTGVCRVMPNVAAAMGLGVFLFVRGTLSGEQVEAVRMLFSLSGTFFALEEDRFDAATAVAGCMPGMLASLVADFAAAAEAHGIDPVAARLLAVEGVHGAAAMIAGSGDPAAVVAAAATPGGMTAAAIASLEASGVADAVQRAVTAAADRAKELA